MSEPLLPLYVSMHNHSRVPYISGYSCNVVENGHFVFHPEVVFRRQFLTLAGQINRTTNFGEFLYTLAKKGPNRWIEIGSWNGLGSTKCILDGFHDGNKVDAKLLSFELDPIMCGVARENLASHPAIARVEFINQKLKSADASTKEYFPATTDIPASEQTDHFFLHYERERSLFYSSPGYVPVFAPEVVLLDGGEYSGYNDWLQVDKSQLKWVCIDDASTFKSRVVVNELKQNSEWICMYENSERYGWAVFKHISAEYI